MNAGVILAAALTMEVELKLRLIDAAERYLDLGKQLDSEGLDYEKDKLAIHDLMALHQRAKQNLIEVIKEAKINRSP
jgi:hypothetical protein